MSWASLQVRLLLCCVATRAFNIETTEAPAAEPLVLGNFGERGRQLSEACCGTVAVTVTGDGSFNYRIWICIRILIIELQIQLNLMGGAAVGGGGCTPLTRGPGRPARAAL